MRKIFIDGGAHRATSVKNFKENYPDAKEYEIFSFEANNNFKKDFEKYPDVKLEIALVWVSDGEQTFYNNNREGSSIYESKGYRRGSGSRFEDSQVSAEIVRTIDLDRWIKENLSEDDHIILKMDIEGAEYEVLDHMIKNGSIKYINKLFIEWHCAKVIEISVDRHLGLLEGLIREELIPCHWSYTSTNFNNIAVSKRNIARKDNSGNNEKLKSFEQLEERYNIICESFRKLQKQSKGRKKE
tara:strand:+ start:123 stop:848 length:726 start_codon:yes stop_codon:yes gene_type:complete